VTVGGPHKLARAATTLAVALGAVVLAGWTFDVEGLKGPLYGVETMKLTTAVGFVLAGMSALLQLESPTSSRRRSAGRACGLLVAALGLVTLAEFTFGIDVGIDQGLRHAPPIKPSTSPLADMAPNTALSFVLAGMALATLDAGGRALRSWSHVLAIAVLVIGFVGVTGHLLSAEEIYGVAQRPAMAVHTAIGLVALSIGVLASRPERGDVSERKQAQKALRESEARLRMAQQVAGIGTFEWNIETGVNTWTPEMEAMHGLRTGSFTGSLEAWQRLVHPEDRGKIVACVGQMLEDGASEGKAEWRVVWPDGTVRWLALHWKVFNSEAGKPLHVTGINIDLTERKRAEQEREGLLGQLGVLNADLEERVRARTVQLTTALKERDVLLQEIHHRVKNNLQVISSLINMQIRKLVDRTSRSGLEGCRARVEAIALIHEKLYQSRDYARVPFSDYAKSLASNIFHASGVSPASITLGVDVEPTLLPVDKAIPCGLILNELITNALKHAFPGGRGGSIRVELRNAPGGAVMLGVSDDGIGLACDVDPRSSTTLGMQLVSTLVEQLDGELEVRRRDGMAFRIIFPLDAERRASIEGD
jgi:PAS domain S-box-containing protein